MIDIGSNTVLVLVMSPDSDAGGAGGAGGKVLVDSARITRIGEGVFETGETNPGARERTRAAIREMAAEARSLGAERVVAVGTEALRRARDGAHFVASLCEEGLVDFARVIEPEVEAALSLEPARRACGGEVCVVDVGGGSTEVAWLGPGASTRGLSLPVGSVRLTERHMRSDPPDPAELEAVSLEVAGVAERVPAALARGRPVVAVAGTATTLAALELGLEVYEGARVEGLELSLDQLRGWIERLAQLSTPQRAELAGLEPGRADVIVAGLLALDGVLARLAATRFQVSERGVRHGLALRLLAGTEPVW